MGAACFIRSTAAAVLAGGLPSTDPGTPRFNEEASADMGVPATSRSGMGRALALSAVVQAVVTASRDGISGLRTTSWAFSKAAPSPQKQSPSRATRRQSFSMTPPMHNARGVRPSGSRAPRGLVGRPLGYFCGCRLLLTLEPPLARSRRGGASDDLHGERSAGREVGRE